MPEVSDKPLLDKLGIKPTTRTAVLGFGERAFMEGREHDTCLKEGTEYDAILFHAPTLQELRDLHKIKHAVGPKTMLWIIYPKGRKDITQNHVFAHGQGIGLVDVKICKFDEERTGLKFLHRRR